MRLIDKDALNERMYHDAFETDSDMQKWDGGCWIRYKMFENAIKDAPTIEERKTGEWIRKISVVDCATFVGDECSQCGYFKSMGQANFCPNCGADMRGGNHETP